MKSKMDYHLYLLVTGEKRQRSESNDSGQSDEDRLPQQRGVSKNHKSYKPASYDISIGCGKEPASGRSYQKKGVPSEHASSLISKRKRVQKGKWNVF